MSVQVGKVERGRTWLPVSYNGNETRFAYPTFQGTHQEVFTAINQEKGLRPAEGIELALLVHGAYSNQEPEWASIKQDAFVSNYTRVPTRNLWLPNGFVSVDGKVEKELRGVLVERDVKGLGLSTRMNTPDLKEWKLINGIYVSPDTTQQFVPESAYSPDFENDGFAIATLTQKGAHIFSQTARDYNKVPTTWKVDVTKISKPEQRVSLLNEYAGLFLCDGGWDGGGDDRGFGVFDSSRSGASA